MYFQVPMKMYAVTQQMDPTNHLALSSRPLVLRQKKHGYQIGCDEQVEQTVDTDGVWQIEVRNGRDWIEQCFTSSSTLYRLHGRRFLRVKRPNQQYQSTEGKATEDKSNNENN